MSDYLGILATVASLFLTFLGIPSQIHRNYISKNTKGFVPYLAITVVLAYLLWGLYGLSKWDWFLIISQSPGFILSLALIAQIWHYRRREKQQT